MNLVGKVFVCLITLMSIVFLSLTVVLYASHKNWKETAAREEEKIKPVQQEKQELVDQKNALIGQIATEKVAYQKTVAALKTKADELNSENDRLIAKNDEIDLALAKRNEIISQNNVALAATQKNIDQLTVDLALAQESRSQYLTDLATAVGDLHERAVTIGDIEKRNRDLQEDFDKAKTVLEMNNLTATPELYDRTPATAIKTVVNAIKDGPTKLVIIGAGTDDGLKSKHTLEVHRDGTYLGRIEVVTTEPHSAVCRVLPQYQQGEIMEGDSVAAKFE